MNFTSRSLEFVTPFVVGSSALNAGTVVETWKYEAFEPVGVAYSPGGGYCIPGDYGRT